MKPVDSSLPPIQQDVSRGSRWEKPCLALMALAVVAFNVIALVQGNISTEVVAGTSIAFLGLHALVLLGDVRSKKQRENQSSSEVAFKVVQLLLALGVIALNAYATAHPHAIAPTQFIAGNIALSTLAFFSVICSSPRKNEPSEKEKQVLKSLHQVINFSENQPKAEFPFIYCEEVAQDRIISLAQKAHSDFTFEAGGVALGLKTINIKRKPDSADQ